MTREPKKTTASLTEDMEEDPVLILRTLDGDDTAFDTLVTRYRDRIYALAFHMLWSREEAEDVAQEVFVRAYRSLAKFRKESGFFTWLYRIAVNLVYTQARKAARQRQVYALAYREMKGSQASPKTPFELAARGELAENLHAALLRVDPRMRQVLVLRELEGLDVGEVAEILHLPKGTVKSRHFRAREDLRLILEQMHGPEKERSGHEL
jgi:RNA polymerase sigma-70 factor (ECF subfamily)